MSSPNLGINGIGDKQISLTAHRALIPSLSPARAAFILMLRANVFGFASLIAKTAFFVDDETTNAQKEGYYYWDTGAKWRNAWWNLGGTWSEFVKAVEAGKNKKPILKNLLPKKIGSKMDALGIGGFGDYDSQTPIGLDPVTVGIATTITTAVTGIILDSLETAATIKLNEKALEAGLEQTEEQNRNAERRIQEAHQLAIDRAKAEEERKKKELEESDYLSLENLLTNEDGSISQAGYGVAGVAVLAALMIGTKQKSKK